MAEIAPGPLEHAPIFDQAGAAVALQPLAGLTHPRIGHEWRAIGLLSRMDDSVLKTEKVGANGLGVHGEN
jgi:hypothetical protein